jgi:hypothetical protein
MGHQRGEFLDDAARSKPIGFYTWSEELVRIFQRDRLLQSPLQRPAAQALTRVLAAEDPLLRLYADTARLTQRLTNPFAWPDLTAAAGEVKTGRVPELPPKVSVLPPSVSHETTLV